MKTITTTEPQLIEINTLIAQFMGYEIIEYSPNVPIYNGNKTAKTVGAQQKLWNGLELQFTGRFTECVKYPFDTDFNYLIPVIRRIEECGYVVHIARISYKIYRVLEEDKPIVSLVCGDLHKKTETTCKLITSFIKWHNTQEK